MKIKLDDKHYLNEEERYRVFICGNLQNYSDDELRHDLQLADEFIKRARGRDEKVYRQDPRIRNQEDHVDHDL